jgi:hypothetical protein
MGWDGQTSRNQRVDRLGDHNILRMLYDDRVATNLAELVPWKHCAFIFMIFRYIFRTSFFFGVSQTHLKQVSYKMAEEKHDPRSLV